jgi:hypothetical protein
MRVLAIALLAYLTVPWVTPLILSLCVTDRRPAKG